ncbi:MAG: hypothetical protein ACRD82_03445 [Blastocatellia bacterium]
MGARHRKSKKQSNTNADYKRQLKRTTFFLDRSVCGNVVIESLRKVGAKVEPHWTRFRHDTEDVEWLAVVGEKKWVVLMGDKAIGRHALELEALLEAKVKAFILTRGGLSAAEQSKMLTDALPQMLRMVEETRFPFLAKIYMDGSVAIWKTEPKFQKGRKSKRRYHPLKEDSDDTEQDHIKL